MPDRFGDAIAEVDDMDFIVKQTVEEYAERLSGWTRSRTKVESLLCQCIHLLFPSGDVVTTDGDEKT